MINHDIFSIENLFENSFIYNQYSNIILKNSIFRSKIIYTIGLVNCNYKLYLDNNEEKLILVQIVEDNPNFKKFEFSKNGIYEAINYIKSLIDSNYVPKRDLNIQHWIDRFLSTSIFKKHHQDYVFLDGISCVIFYYKKIGFKIDANPNFENEFSIIVPEKEDKYFAQNEEGFIQAIDEFNRNI